MKKRVLTGLAVVATAYFGLSSYISNNTEKYIKELATSSLSSVGDSIYLKKYDPEKKVAVITKNIYDKDGIEFNVTEGPIFSLQTLVGLVELSKKGKVEEFFIEDKESIKKYTQEFLKKDLNIDYRAVLDFAHIVHEDVKVSTVKYQDKSTAVTVSPISIVSNYVSKTTKGKTYIKSEKVSIKELNGNGKIDINKPYINIYTNEPFQALKNTFVYGKYNIGSENISVYQNNNKPLKFTMSAQLNIDEEIRNRININTELFLNAINNSTPKAWENIKSLNLNMSVEKLGADGIEELNRVQEEQNRLSNNLANALAENNEIEIQRTIIQLQELEDAWIGIYNKLFIKNETRFKFETDIKTDKDNNISMDFTFTGDKIECYGISALVALSSNLDRLFKGKIHINIEKRLLYKFYPDAVLILDSMVKQNLAEIKNGVYNFDASVNNGYILIKDREYSPQELIIKILMY